MKIIHHCQISKFNIYKRQIIKFDTNVQEDDFQNKDLSENITVEDVCCYLNKSFFAVNILFYQKGQGVMV